MKRDDSLTIAFYDLVSEEKYKLLMTVYLTNITIVVVMFYFDNRDSFENLNNWIDFVKTSYTKVHKEFIIVGNKSDIEDKKVTEEELIEFTSKNNLELIKISCLNQEGIDELMKKVIEIYNTKVKFS